MITIQEQVTQLPQKISLTESFRVYNESEYTKHNMLSYDGVGNARLLDFMDFIISKVISIYSSKRELILSEENLFKSDVNKRLSLIDFIKKISKFLCLNHEVYTVLAMMLFDKFLRSNPTFFITESNVYIIILMSFFVATKANSELFVPISKLTMISGLSDEILEQHEIDFLIMIDYDSVILEERFNKYKSSLMEKIKSF